MPARVLLTESQFAAYPPQARRRAIAHLATLNRLPPLFTALLLRELIGYDQQFPAERIQMDAQLELLSAPWSPELKGTMDKFDDLPIAPSLEDRSPAPDPVAYVDQVTAFLWTAHAIEAFRAAGSAYGEQLALLDAAAPHAAVSPLVLVLIGRGASPQNTSLFRRLRPQGTLFSAVQSQNCLDHALHAVLARAADHPQPYAHWYIEGDSLATAGRNPSLASVSYGGTASLRNLLLEKVHSARVAGTVGPEDLRTMLTRLTPQQLGGGAAPTADEVMRYFELRLLTEGSGTQIYSTSFVQWAAREALRRARPQTMLVRFAPRQAERSLNELLIASSAPEHLDPEGSLADADMAAYYTWLNLQRLAGAQTSRFIAIFEGGTQAIAISPAVSRHSESKQQCTLRQILEWTA